jgi:hypothetical protein
MVIYQMMLDGFVSDLPFKSEVGRHSGDIKES